MIEIHVVDAFTHDPYAGNPAGVCRLGTFPSDRWMQAVAAEVNLSETAFVVRRTDGDHDLRWFTPTTEVELCGHATLATAHVLGGDARFHTRSGVLTCRAVPAGGGRSGGAGGAAGAGETGGAAGAGETGGAGGAAGAGEVEMDFPADPAEPVPVPAGLAPEVRGCVRGRSDLLIELPAAADVRAYQPDLARIATLDCRCLIVTAAGDGPGTDFVSRVFCPAVGVPEDPVTGSAHCTLAGYWAARTGRAEMVGHQASARGGTVGVRLAGDRVTLRGAAITVSRIELLVEPAG